MDNVYRLAKQEDGFGKWILYLAGLVITTNLLFGNYSSLLSNNAIFLYYLITGVIFIVLVVLLILLPKQPYFLREIWILSCLAMIFKVVYQATLFL